MKKKKKTKFCLKKHPRQKNLKLWKEKNQNLV